MFLQYFEEAGTLTINITIANAVHWVLLLALLQLPKDFENRNSLIMKYD